MLITGIDPSLLPETFTTVSLVAKRSLSELRHGSLERYHDILKWRYCYSSSLDSSISAWFVCLCFSIALLSSSLSVSAFLYCFPIQIRTLFRVARNLGNSSQGQRLVVQRINPLRVLTHVPRSLLVSAKL
jgi:hypothetical protein